jgi:hypothetical protein
MNAVDECSGGVQWINALDKYSTALDAHDLGLT